MLEVPLRALCRVIAIALVRRRAVYAGGVLGLVCVDDDVSLVVVASTDQPAEDSQPVIGIGIGDPALRGVSKDRRHVIAGDGTPVRLPIAGGPALDQRESPLHPRPVAID